MNKALEFFRAQFEGERNALAERVSLAKMVQQPGQSIVEYGSSLQMNARHCAYPAGYTDQAMRDVFVAGVSSESVRQAICRAIGVATKAGRNFSLESAMEAACMEQQALDIAISLSSLPVKAEFVVTTATSSTDRSFPSNSSVSVRTCNWCGLSYHRRLQCPAREQHCRKCGKKGHFVRICKSRDSKVSSAATEPLDSVAAVTDKHESQQRFLDMIQRGRSLQFLLDSGSDISQIRLDVSKQFRISYTPVWKRATSANGAHIKIIGMAHEQVELGGQRVPITLYVAALSCNPWSQWTSSIFHITSALWWFNAAPACSGFSAFRWSK